MRLRSEQSFATPVPPVVPPPLATQVPRPNASRATQYPPANPGRTLQSPPARANVSTRPIKSKSGAGKGIWVFVVIGVMASRFFTASHHSSYTPTITPVPRYQPAPVVVPRYTPTPNAPPLGSWRGNTPSPRVTVTVPEPPGTIRYIPLTPSTPQFTPVDPNGGTFSAREQRYRQESNSRYPTNSSRTDR